MLRLTSSPVRIGFVIAVVGSLAAYAVGCGTDVVDTFGVDDAGSADGATGMDAGGSDAGHPGNDSAVMDAFVSDGSYCQLVDDRIARCDAGTVNDVACHAQEACFDNVLRPAASAPYKGCITGRACGVNDDTCIVEAGMPFLDAGPFQTFQSDCLTKHTACVSQDAGFLSDYCSALQSALLNDVAFGRLQACVSGACPQVKTCTAGIFVEAGCN